MGGGRMWEGGFGIEEVREGGREGDVVWEGERG